MFKKLSISALVLTGAVLFAGGHDALAYDVKAGDTMNKVASNHSMSLNELAGLNPSVKDINLIYIGQKLNTNNNESQKVSKPVTKVETVTNTNSHEVDLMARLVRAEAESEPYAGKVAVAEVILNRVSSSQFPNSIESVIYQKGQFSPVTSGTINRAADSESLRAANEAINSSRKDSQSLFFYNPNIATSSWLDSRQTVKTIGHHVFKR